MTLDQIKAAVESGKTVCWSNDGYRVIKDSIGQWLVHYTPTNNYWGLTHQDGTTVNGKPHEFFIKEPVMKRVPAVIDALESRIATNVTASRNVQWIIEAKGFAHTGHGTTAAEAAHDFLVRNHLESGK
jgi:hypothetical protein